MLQIVKVLRKSAVRNGAQRNAERLICSGSAEPVGVHDLELAEHFAPVSERHRPLLRYLIGRKIQRFQKSRIAWKDAPLLVKTAIAAVQAFYRIGSVYKFSDLCRELENRRNDIPVGVLALHCIWIFLLPLFGAAFNCFCAAFSDLMAVCIYCGPISRSCKACSRFKSPLVVIPQVSYIV